MITGAQDIWNLIAFEIERPRKMRMLKRAILKALELNGGFVTDNTIEQAGYGINEEKRRRFATAQHEIAYGDLMIDVFSDKALIDPLVTAADHNEPGFTGEIFDDILGQARALGRKEDHRTWQRALFVRCFHGGFHFRRRSEEHTSELQSRGHLVCRLLLEKK